jgi:hypothetical protein
VVSMVPVGGQRDATLVLGEAKVPTGVGPGNESCTSVRTRSGSSFVAKGLWGETERPTAETGTVELYGVLLPVLERGR